ncbi:MAG: hypothetical protein WA066_02960 [Candidatus Omnitrophota bacterium]
MNFDNLGYGTGGGLISGLITAIAVAFGFKSRLDRQDKDIDSLKKNVVYRDTFEEFKERFISLDNKVDKIDGKLSTLITRRRDDRKQ